MHVLQVGVLGLFFAFVVIPATALAAGIALSVYEVYRIGERKLLLVIVILGLMLQHQLLEAYAFLQAGEAVAEGIGEVFETGANLIAAASVYYVLRFARRERRLVEDLERSERQYRNLIDESPVPILLHGPDEIRYANDAAVEMFDAPDQSAVTGTALATFLPDEEPDGVRETILTDGGADVVESPVRTLADRTRHAALTSAPADYEGTDVRQIVVQDLTEQKRREREYEQIFDSVTNGITVFHPETGEILDVNETYHEMLGYDDLETIKQLGIEGLSVAEEGYTGDRGRQLIREVADSGETTTVEWRGERKDGTRLWLEATLTPAEIGGEQRVLSIQRDVTARKRREREYEQIFDSVQDGIVVWEPASLDIVDANDAYLEMLGYDDLEQLREQGVDGLSVTDEGYTLKQAMEIHQRVIDTGEPELVEWRGETSDGERIWLEVKVAPAVIGGEQRTISINRDVTARKRREQRLEVFNRILRHNLRNHLDVIKSHAEALVDRTDGDHAAQIIASADRLAAMGARARTIDRFMARERQESTVDLANLVRQTLQSIDGTCAEVTVTTDLPRTASLVTDSEVLETVISNALDNAIRYAETTVAVSVEATADGYAVTIDDDGPGIPAGELAPLDAETETELTHGRGLGLWQLKWGVTKLNGDLSFDTSQGTTVRITIPDLQPNGDDR